MNNYTQCTISYSLGGFTKMYHSQLKMHQNGSMQTYQSDQKYGGENLTESTLSFFLYNHRKIKTSNFSVTFRVTKCGRCF